MRYQIFILNDFPQIVNWEIEEKTILSDTDLRNEIFDTFDEAEEYLNAHGTKFTRYTIMPFFYSI